MRDNIIGFICGAVAFLVILHFVNDFRNFKYKNTTIITQIDSSIAAVNRVLTDYIRPIEIIEQQKQEIHYRDSLIWDMTRKIEKVNHKPEGE